MDQMYRVFISSTYEDLKEERNEVLKALLDLGCVIPSGMEYFPAADEHQWDFIKELIKECDYYVVIIGGRYGSTFNDGMSYIEREYRFAQAEGIPIIAFIHENIQSIPASKVDKDLDKLNVFLDFIKKQKLHTTWRNKEGLAAKVMRSLIQQKKRTPRIGWIKGNKETEEHSNLIVKYNKLNKKFRKLKHKSLIDPVFYKDYDHAFPALEKILNELIKDEIYKSEPLKIRIMGVCFHKSFPLLKGFLEENAGSGKRIEVRLSKLHKESKIMEELNNTWNSYYGAYEHQRDELINNLRKIANANVSIKVTKYSHMPNWHGILINKKYLFLSACIWNSDQRMTAGENHYIFYKKGLSPLHEKKIIQFIRWFDYGRFHGYTATSKENQLLIDTRESRHKPA